MKFFYNLCLKDDGADLDSDILSGVRRGYFSGFQRISDRITVNSDGDSILYDYTIEKGKPMSWTVRTADKRLMQDVASAGEGKYYLSYYRDEKLCKRILFSRLHTLLRVEYYDLPTGLLTVSLEPRKAKGGLCILYESAAAEQPIALYPMDRIDDERLRERVTSGFTDYTLTASTDEGTVLFLSDQQEKALKDYIDRARHEIAAQDERSYVGDDTPLFDRINPKDFNVKRNLAASLDITCAEEFRYPRKDADDEQLAAQEAEASAVAEAAAAAINMAMAMAPADQPAAGADVASDQAADASSGVSEPDKLIMADGAVYRYYGSLDASGNRSGFGRTLTEEGRTAYEGGYYSDKRSGYGSYFYKDGRLCYTGDWVENARHGVGVGVSSRDGSVHVGRWALNKPEGSGVRLSADGDIRFVCKELGDGTTVLMNFLPDDALTIAKYDEKGKKLGETTLSLKNLLK